MKKSILCVFIFSIISSCTSSNNIVKIINESESKIDSILLIGNQKCSPLVLKNITPNNSKTGALDNCNKSGGDGSYILKLYVDNNEITKGFGYYTNGVMYFDEFVIKFTKDNSIIITEKF
ncbi:hypothetical protein [Flavobacterium tibetense]|uniref:Lipoprotein n=1 Tax=Flavobacterium tibetense TaxID=2233533 RepID=A0A365P4Q5_9FLAO|nr:hypothetical protein [Flavobacterium tibetense]RBA29578.1 hypothetical protein DPN68_02740 [Flavobacterium tibetense]